MSSFKSFTTSSLLLVTTVFNSLSYYSKVLLRLSSNLKDILFSIYSIETASFKLLIY